MDLSIPFKKRWLSLLCSMMLMAAIVPLHGYAQYTMNISSSDEMDVDFISRLSHENAEAALTTREGSVDLLLTNEAIVIQFTDSFLQVISDDMEESEEYGEASIIGDMFRSMISSGVRSLLDNALAIPLYEIEQIYLEDERLVMVNRQGEEILEDLEIDDVKVLEDFPIRDAVDFITETEKRMK